MGYLDKLDNLTSKYRLIRMSSDWTNIEFHHIKQSNHKLVRSKEKKPKFLRITNIRYIYSAFSDRESNINQVYFSKSKNTTTLLLCAWDKNRKEVIMKIVCESRNY